ncbi:hypothetical protein MSAN_01995800 [Mycena sanguinolenta]|uniref:Zn(2)-C6 fungal-type domain-containing protein n=1 Tax=Mycena sanguinolenta TaxID=230812 RepID=A0A8H6XLU5_9AGAR|nr:hypothetical protein MSAN_01995800 [Mycena sanguinolenta]
MNNVTFNGGFGGAGGPGLNDGGAGGTGGGPQVAMNQTLFQNPPSTSKVDIANAVWGNIYSAPPNVNPGQILLPWNTMDETVSDCDNYSNQLLHQKRGFPLYSPGPPAMLPAEYRAHGIQIGDVGTVTPQGVFDFLFNIYLPGQHPININNAPDGFQPLTPEYNLSRDGLLEDYAPGIHVSTASVYKLFENSQANQFPGGDFSFSCRAPRGAVVALPHGSQVKSLRTVELVREYARMHAISWYAHMKTRGITIANGSLYLVTGCEKAKSWGIASYHNIREKDEFQASFRCTFGTPTPHYQWIGIGQFPGQHKHHNLVSSDGDNGLNQTIFIRGLCISLGNRIWQSLFKTTVEVTDMEESRLGGVAGRFGSQSQSSSLFSWLLSPSSGGTSYGRQHGQAVEDVVLSNFPDISNIFHPGKLLNNYLVEKVPAADVIITHDDDWVDILAEDFSMGSKIETLSDLHEYIAKEFSIKEKADEVAPRMAFLVRRLELSAANSIPPPSGSDMVNEGLTSANQKRKQTDEHERSTTQTTPLQLRRRRVWRACESCRRKKIKCDGCDPICSQCTASGTQCTWLQTKDRAALSRHYVQELEARLLHMESLFSQIAPVLDQLGPLPNGAAIAELTTTTSTPAPSDSDTIPSAVHRHSIPSKDWRSSTSTKADVSESFGQLALDEHGHMRWIGGSSTKHIQSFKAPTTSALHRTSSREEDSLAPGPSDERLYFPVPISFGKVHALPEPEEVEFPPRDLADKLVNAYFSRSHFLNPVIDKPLFLRKYAQIMDNLSEPQFVQSEAAFGSLVFAVFACSASLIEDSRLSISESLDEGGMGMVYYERALLLQYISQANTQIAHVQCFILLSSFLCSVNRLPQAWILLGQAVRIGQDLGLHRSPSRLVITAIEKETRRKTWWGAYALDRMLALALGRPLGINDTDCDVEYPVEVDDEHLPEYFAGVSMPQPQPSLMAGAVALIRLYKIGGRVLREVYALDNCKDYLDPERKAELQRTVEGLDTELTEWCEDLPAVFKSQSQTDEQVSMGAVLCSHYYSVLTTLHRNFLPVKRDQVASAKSTVKAVSAARSCIRLAPSMKNVVPPSHHLAFLIQHLFSSAVILLLYAMHSSEPRAASAAMDEARSSLNVLESWEEHWPGARKCKEILIELTSTASAAVAQGMSETTPPLPAAGPSVSAGRVRRRSGAIATRSRAGSASGSESEKVAKNKPRRNQSRDPGTSIRPLATVSPYRVDSAQRRRSTSRRRGHDDGEENERFLYYQSFASPRSAHTSSPHSSPASVKDENTPPPSPTLAPNATIFNYSPSTSPMNTSGQFNHEMEFRPQGGDIYTSPGLYSSNTHGGYDPPDSFGYYGDLSRNLAELSSTPPTPLFADIGWPFLDLDYIRNFGNSGGYSMSEQDSLWNTYDPGAFEYDPDLPFTLGDNTSDNR